MADPADLACWRGLLIRLRESPPPSDEESDLCRQVLAVAPGTAEGALAARHLLERAMCDATTSIDEAQLVMSLLKALDAGTVTVAGLLAE